MQEEGPTCYMQEEMGPEAIARPTTIQARLAAMKSAVRANPTFHGIGEPHQESIEPVKTVRVKFKHGSQPD